LDLDHWQISLQSIYEVLPPFMLVQIAAISGAAGMRAGELEAPGLFAIFFSRRRRSACAMWNQGSGITGLRGPVCARSG
jgi:hypothetical protein